MGNSATSARTSRPFAFFEQASTELYDKLRDLPGIEASTLAERARQLRDRFQAWDTRRPSDDERVKAIQELMDFSREAREYLARM